MIEATDKFIGLDGYPNGWVAVWLSGARQEIEFVPDLSTILKLKFDRAMIDMPIGMPTHGYRTCDLEARKRLSPNQSRVFLGARRSFLNCRTHPEASAVARAGDGKGVSIQMFCILPKLKQLDAIMSSEHQHRLMECHPELVFWRLHNQTALPGKKTEGGRTLRKSLLQRAGINRLDDMLESRMGTGAKIDDVLDACACAIAARDKTSSKAALGGETDEKGLKMKIHY
jgi:predicted RNase H-like nuclease